MGIRDEYAPRFGRQVLTLWGGAFCGEYAGEAVELPGHDGYMVTSEHGAFRVRVECEAPRTDENYLRVDAAIESAFDAAREAWSRDVLRREEARKVARAMSRAVGARFLAGAR